MSTSLEHGVGPRGKNRPLDIGIVEELLNRALTQDLPIKWDGLPGATLFDRIGRFQATMPHSRHPDQQIDPHGGTLHRLVHAAQPIAPNPSHVQGSAAYDGWFFLDIDKFVLLYGRQFDHNPAGLPVLATKIKADPSITDIRWAAYMLATAYWETARTFEPIREIGRGAGHDYGNPATYKDANGHTHSNVYYGRGYVQLTWLENYRSLGQAIGVGDALAIDADKALDPENAYKVMSYGMTNGSFSTAHHKLADYIHDRVCDYQHARRIINLMDHAHDIAAMAVKLEMLLRLATG